MSAILVSDTHFTDSPRDSYRWGLFEFLRKQVEKYKVSQIIHCGDVCDAKDRHPANLVNRLIFELRELSKLVDVFILAGNHDSIDLANPFFSFIDQFETNVTLISQPTDFWLNFGSRPIRASFLPCAKDLSQKIKNYIFDPSLLVFSHCTYTGAKSETGITLEGISPALFKDFKGKVFSGDIHVPQVISRNIEYVGSPTRIRFGDAFTPRLILLDDSLGQTNLYYPCISKHTVVGTSLSDVEKEADRLNVKAKDQVKVRVRLPRSQFPSWNEIREQIKDLAAKREWDLYGPELHQLEDRSIKRLETPQYKSSSEIVAAYGAAKKLTSQQVNVGLSILKEI